MDATATLLSRLGFSAKEQNVYLALLASGPSSVRKVAEKAGVNRGTTHDALRALTKQGLVSYYHKEKHQYFVAEDPAHIEKLLERQKNNLKEIQEALKDTVPQLRLMWSEKDEKPVVKYYENYEGTRSILENVLETVAAEKKKEYAVFSSAAIRTYLYKAFPNYNEERIKQKIFVRAIAIGAGGKEAGLDERRWLSEEGNAPTYTLLYGGKVAMISVGAKDTPHGLIIEDRHIYETHMLIFNALWEKLKPSKPASRPSETTSQQQN